MHLTKFYLALTGLALTGLASALTIGLSAARPALALPSAQSETVQNNTTHKPAPKPESKPAAKPESKPAAKPESTTKPAAKPESKPAPKPESATKPTKKHEDKVSTSKLVPPPPPNTPSLMIDPSMPALMGMPVEYLGKESLKDREKEISLQYKDAAAELASRKAQSAEKLERARDFEALYTEGVVSRRELEQSKRDAADASAEISRLENKTSELKALLDRIHTRQASFEKKNAQSEFNKLTGLRSKPSKSRGRTITQK